MTDIDLKVDFLNSREQDGSFREEKENSTEKITQGTHYCEPLVHISMSYFYSQVKILSFLLFI